MRSRFLAGMFCCLPAFAGFDGGQAPAPLPDPIGPVTPLTSPAAEGAAEPNLAVDARGRVWLTWLEPRPGGGHRFRLSQLAGTQWAPPSTIAEGTNFFA